MMDTRGMMPSMIPMGLGIVIVLLVAGCSGWFGKTTASSPSGDSAPEKGPIPLYHDFGDVLIPSELKVVKQTSFVFKTPGLSAGVLSLRGRVDANSLIAFFESNMVKDNWDQVSAFKSNRSMLLYKKESRWCVINITEKEFYTYLEIWVAPTVQDSETDLLEEPLMDK